MAYYCEVSFPLPLLQTFTYRLPESLVNRVKVGDKVLAPFGSRQLAGYVLEIKQLEQEPAFKVKEITDLRVNSSSFSASFISFIKELARKSLVSPGQLLDLAEVYEDQEVIKVMVKLTAEGQARLERGDIKGRKKEILELLKGRKLSPVYLKRKTGIKNINSYLRVLKKDGLVDIEEKQVKKRKSSSINQEVKIQLQLPLSLTEAQEIKQIIRKVREKVYVEFLVAGSWSRRARYFSELISSLVGQSNYILILVPEIQRMRRWQELVKQQEELVIFHSQLTPTQRREALRRISSGRARLILGTRSLALMPVEPVSLIIVDEEQDELYYQTEGIPFDGKEAARLRAKHENGVLVLTSSCPEISSYYWHEKAETLLDLGQEKMVCDYQVQSGEGTQIFRSELKDKLIDQVRERKPVFIYVNKKGYAGYVQCARCHFVPKCQQCQIALSSNKPGQELSCRYCGKTYPWPEKCPVCGQKMRVGRVKGSQYFKEELAALLPDTRIVVLEEGNDHPEERALHKALSGRKISIVVGTEYALTRLWPLTFSLVLVVNPEIGLNLPDFRASEMVFAKLSAVTELVANEKGSQFIVVTELPDNAVLRLAIIPDYRGFYEREIEIRKLLGYPPFCPLININLSGNSIRSSARLSRALLEQMQKNFPEAEIIGPKVARHFWHHQRKEIRFYLRFKEQSRLEEFINFLYEFKLKYSSSRLSLKFWL
ncbi:MAG: primosomal protein N' [Candidatus Aminicenantes bacterium]|nr:primosomal protein N' [Candidatus Aminicenantes bacterium]